MASTRIRYGDVEYQEIWDDWVVNARPRQFSREGAWGGALYRIRNPEGVVWDSVEYPDFYQAASLGPTVVDETETGKGRVVTEGWHLINQEDGFSMEHWEDKEVNPTGTRIRTRIKEMPNEL